MVGSRPRMRIEYITKELSITWYLKNKRNSVEFMVEINI
jgi:hypothetical protein